MKWIKTSERLPEDYTPVFVNTKKDKYVLIHHDIAWYEYQTDSLYMYDTDPDNNLEWLDETQPSFTLQDMIEYGRHCIKWTWEQAGEEEAEKSPEKQYFKIKFNLDI